MWRACTRGVRERERACEKKEAEYKVSSLISYSRTTLPTTCSNLAVSSWISPLPQCGSEQDARLLRTVPVM